MQIICTSLQKDNHASTSSLIFLQAECSSWCPTNSVKVKALNFLKALIGVGQNSYSGTSLPGTVNKRFSTTLTRMWANAQRDGRSAEYRWRPVFNAAKFGWRRLLECRAVTLPRGETRRNLLGCPKLTKRSQPLVGRSSPYCKDMWGRYCCLTCFFRLSIHALVAKT